MLDDAPAVAPPEALALYQEARWETECFRRGIERYREAAAQKNPEELAGGRRLLREIVPPLVAAIGAARDEAADALTASGGRRQPWFWPIQLLDPEPLAVITTTCAIRGCLSAATSGASRASERGGALVAVAKHVAAGARIQIEYDTWAKENPDVEKRLRRRFPDMDKRVWTKWRARLEATRLDPWSEGVATAFGCHLLHLLCVAAPHRFTVETVPLMGGRTRLHLVPSDATLELVADLEARAEVAMPLLRPMICPPIPWRYEETTR